MARARSISKIDADIAKVTSELVKVQQKQEALEEQLLELQKLKRECEAKRVMDAFYKSDKSIDELMTFLDV